MPGGGLTSSMRSSTAVFSPELNAVGAPVAARFPNCTLPPVEKISWLPIGPFPGALARTSIATVTAAATSATAAAAAQRRRIRRRCSGAAATDCSVGPAIALVGSWSGSASQPAREYAPGDHRRLPSVGAADVVRLVGRAAEVVIELDVAVEPRPGRQADAEHVHPAAPPDRAVDLAMKRPARLIEPADRVVAHAPVQRAALLAGGLAAEEAGGHDRVVGPSLAVVVSDLLEALVVKPRLNLARVAPNLAVRDAALVANVRLAVDGELPARELGGDADIARGFLRDAVGELRLRAVVVGVVELADDRPGVVLAHHLGRHQRAILGSRPSGRGRAAASRRLVGGDANKRRRDAAGGARRARGRE